MIRFSAQRALSSSNFYSLTFGPIRDTWLISYRAGKSKREKKKKKRKKGLKLGRQDTERSSQVVRTQSFYSHSFFEILLSKAMVLAADQQFKRLQ